MFVLLRVPEDLPPTMVWAQGTTDLRQRLADLVEDPPPRLARYLERGQLHFRAAAVPDTGQRRSALTSVLSNSIEFDPARAR